MRLLFLSTMILLAISLCAQTTKIEKIYPKSDTTKAEGTVYKKGETWVRAKSDISAAMLSLDAEVRNNTDVFIHIEEVETEIVYRKTTQNAKGIYKTSEKGEKAKLKDVLLKPQSSIFFKKNEKLDKEAAHGIAYLTGVVSNDKITELKPANEYKKKLSSTETVCGGFYNIEFAIYTKKVKVEDAYLEDGTPAFQFIPFLILENKSKRDVTFKGKLEVVFTYNGLYRELKFDLPGLQAGEKKEREAKGAIPIVNYTPDVYFIRMLNTPEVTFKE